MRPPLPARFEQAIDRCAMKIGAKADDAYMAEWRKVDMGEVSGDPAEAVTIDDEPLGDEPLGGFGGQAAVPAAAFAMSRWLDGFAYRIALEPWPFVAAGLLALLVALLAVSAHALRAATADPVKALRYE